MAECMGQPDLVPAALVRCGEEPYCDPVQCFTRVACLTARSTAAVLSGCRTPSDNAPYFCVCPIENDPINRMALNQAQFSAIANDTDFAASAGGSGDSKGLSGGAIAGIVIGVILAVLLIALGLYVLFRVKESRRNHGEYRPQLEEFQHAKDLPYLQPPAIEGLI